MKEENGEAVMVYLLREEESRRRVEILGDVPSLERPKMVGEVSLEMKNVTIVRNRSIEKETVRI